MGDVYEINGICLQGSEYGLLKQLVDRYDGGDEWSGVLERFDSDYADGRIDDAFQGLLDKGLIDGDVTPARIMVNGFSQKGLDFVHDYEARETESLLLRKEQYRHDFRVALVGAVTGGLLGLIGGCFSSEFMALLRTIIS